MSETKGKSLAEVLVLTGSNLQNMRDKGDETLAIAAYDLRLLRKTAFDAAAVLRSLQKDQDTGRYRVRKLYGNDYTRAIKALVRKFGDAAFNEGGMMSNKPVELLVHIHRPSNGKSIAISDDGDEDNLHYIPLSKVTFITGDEQTVGQAVIEIPEWLAIREGLV